MKKIAIFDDDTDILELCRFILEQKGYKVYTRADCNDLIDHIQQFNPDVILMDNWIPEIGGIESTRLIKKHEDFKNIPIIYFSANNDIKSLAAQAGADKFLAKPFDIDVLEDLIKSTVSQQ